MATENNCSSTIWRHSFISRLRCCHRYRNHREQGRQRHQDATEPSDVSRSNIALSSVYCHNMLDYRTLPTFSVFKAQCLTMFLPQSVLVCVTTAITLHLLLPCCPMTNEYSLIDQLTAAEFYKYQTSIGSYMFQHSLDSVLFGCCCSCCQQKSVQGRLFSPWDRCDAGTLDTAFYNWTYCQSLLLWLINFVWSEPEGDKITFLPNTSISYQTIDLDELYNLTTRT